MKPEDIHQHFLAAAIDCAEKGAKAKELADYLEDAAKGMRLNAAWGLQGHDLKAVLLPEVKQFTLTAVVTEVTSPYPPVYDRPLIYTVKVTNPNDRAEILQEVAAIRCSEIGDPEDFDEIMEGLRLEFVFEGDQPTAGDWR